MPDHLSAYILTVIAVSGTPGPVMMLALKAGTSHGRGAGFAVILASLAGSALVLAVVSAALATIASASERVFLVLQIAFALYLVWIGIKSWPARPAEDAAEPDTAAKADDAPEAPAASRAIVRDAFLVALTNPKAYVFFAAVFSQFVHADRPAALQVAVLSVIFIAIDGIWQGVYLTVGRSLRLVDNTRFHFILNRLVAVVFVLLGAFMTVESLRQVL